MVGILRAARRHSVAATVETVGAVVDLAEGHAGQCFGRLSRDFALGEGPNDQHFGLGEAFDPTTDTIAQVRVSWPASGAVQLLADVPANQRLVVREDE